MVHGTDRTSAEFRTIFFLQKFCRYSDDILLVFSRQNFSRTSAEFRPKIGRNSAIIRPKFCRSSVGPMNHNPFHIDLQVNPRVWPEGGRGVWGQNPSLDGKFLQSARVFLRKKSQPPLKFSVFTKKLYPPRKFFGYFSETITQSLYQNE